MLRNALIRRLILGLALAGPAACAGTTAEAGGVVTAGETVETYNIFYPALSPYGEWFWIDEFGDVWQPSVAVAGAGFTLHVGPFRYGRWWLSPDRGWVWVPDVRYGTGRPRYADLDRLVPGQPQPSKGGTVESCASG